MPTALSALPPLQSRASGVFMSGSGLSAEVGGPLEILFASAVGGVAGLVAGLVCGTVSRLLTLNRLRGVVGGMHWGAYGAGLGAVSLALIEWFA